MRTLIFAFILISLLSLERSYAHGGHHHGHHEDQTAPPTPDNFQKDQMKLINERYISEIKPIFKRSCFDCHSSQTQHPWYHQIPGIRQWMNHDISEAREHIDFEHDFPFGSHASLSEDLDSIIEEIKDDDMPPLSYRIMHPGSKLTTAEKDKVKQWVDFTREKLKPE